MSDRYSPADIFLSYCPQPEEAKELLARGVRKVAFASCDPCDDGIIEEDELRKIAAKHSKRKK